MPDKTVADLVIITCVWYSGVMCTVISACLKNLMTDILKQVPAASFDISQSIGHPSIRLCIICAVEKASLHKQD